MPTLDDATRCPKCSQQGKMVSEKPGPRGSKVYVIHCQNNVCPWLDTGWTVQVKSDDTIPEREQGPKVYNHLSSTDKAIAERMIREIGRPIE